MLAVVLLVALTVASAATVGTVLFGQAAALDDPAPRASLSLSVTGDRITVVHESGDALSVDSLRVKISVDGESLAKQPPVPFFAAEGFAPGPTGPFNSATDPEWTAGEVASLRVAGTNTPSLETGDEVTVDIYQGEQVVATLTATVENAENSG